MSRLFHWSWLLGVLLLALPVRAKEIAVITAPAGIPAGQTREFGFGTVPQRETTVLLKIRSRLNSTGLGGSSGFMKVELNGQLVRPAKSRTAQRLLNKPLLSPVTSSASAPWYEMRDDAWRVLYSPDFKAALAQKFYVGDPYLLVLDVTDLVNPVAENRLKITNTATEKIKEYAKADAALVIGSLEIETKPVPSPMMAPSNNIAPLINRGEPAAGAAEYRGEVLPGGGFALRVGGSTYRFHSAFSYPNAGFNYLAAGAVKNDGQNGWQVKASASADARAGRVTAGGADYRIARTIEFGPRRVEITDRITNLHRDAPLGLAVRHEMELSGMPDAQVRLAGIADPAINDYYAPGNPSVHVRLKNSGIGLIAEDDVLRNQALLYARVADKTTSPVAGLRTEMLRLAPGETYALRWAVYPVAGPDYYDFINLVRTDWGANFTVHGACWWGSSPDQILNLTRENLRATLLGNGIRQIQVTGSWVDHKLDPKDPAAPRVLGFGTAVFEPHFADYRRRVREAVEKVHQAVPGVQVLGYYDVQRDSSENSAQKFADSALVSAEGKPLSTDWGGRYTLSYNMVPTLQNSFGRAALETARRYLDEMKLDGIYWDEMEITGYGSPLLSYQVFDGHTCQLDPETWTIVREMGVSALATKAFRLAVIDAVQKKGGVLLGNGPSGELDELRTRTPHMIEIQHNDLWSYQGNLETPLGYMAGGSDWPNFLRAFEQAMLPITTLPYDAKLQQYRYPHDITPFLFPFTPIELHAGYLLGQERIIATHSGNYGWPGERVLVVSRCFDKEGKLTSRRLPSRITLDEARTAVELNEKEAVVLERTLLSFAPPAGVLPAGWSATVTVQQYDAAGITLEISAPGGGTLAVRDGLFPLAEKQRVAVQLNGRNSVRRVAERALRLPIPAGFRGTCRLTAPP